MSNISGTLNVLVPSRFNRHDWGSSDHNWTARGLYPEKDACWVGCASCTVQCLATSQKDILSIRQEKLTGDENLAEERKKDVTQTLWE